MKKLEIIQYTQSLRKYSLPEGVREILQGLSIEEQAKHFRIKVDSDVYTNKPQPLQNFYSFVGVIVDNEIIVGVMLSDCYEHAEPCYIGDIICTWDSSDNNGAGCKSRTDCAKLIFLPEIE